MRAMRRALTSTATDEVGPAIQAQKTNSPATGAPSISGTVRVGEDADGRHLCYRRRRRVDQRFLQLPVGCQ